MTTTNCPDFCFHCLPIDIISHIAQCMTTDALQLLSIDKYTHDTLNTQRHTLCKKMRFDNMRLAVAPKIKHMFESAIKEINVVTCVWIDDTRDLRILVYAPDKLYSWIIHNVKIMNAHNIPVHGQSVFCHVWGMMVGTLLCLLSCMKSGRIGLVPHKK